MESKTVFYLSSIKYRFPTCRCCRGFQHLW